MTTPPALIGDACLATYQRLLDECLRFKASQLYFTMLERAATRDGGLAKDAHVQLLEKLAPHYASPFEYFAERSFIMLVASLELFIHELVHAIIMAYPKKVGHIEFRLSEVLDAGSPAELVRRSIEQTMSKLMYKKPNEYLSEVASLLSIDEAPLRADWLTFVEAKARRDLAVHNGWRCNSTYLRKLTEAGLSTPFALGGRVFPPAPEYLDQVREAVSTLARLLMSAVFAKHGATLSLPHK
jgi:hypothetical protein